MTLTCRHCCRRKVHRPRGLCWQCYYAPGVRDLYQSVSKFARRGVGAGWRVSAPLPVPTPHRPGSAEKMAVLAARAAAGEQLFHPQDAAE